MEIYCGTDIIEVARIKDAIDNTKGFKENIYSAREIAEIDDIKSYMRYERYAGRFAAKEAVYKAISKILIENNFNIGFTDIEIENVKELRNRPRVNILNETLNKLFTEKNVKIDVSISHVNDNAVANAVAYIE